MSGVVNVEVDTGGGAFGLTPDGGLVPVAGGSTSHHVQESNLAAMAAPPERRHRGDTVVWWILAASIAGGLLGTTAGGKVWVWTGLGTLALFSLLLGPLSVRLEREDKADYARGYAEWERTWFCHRCGHLFIP
jgi:hypothetical protein